MREPRGVSRSVVLFANVVLVVQAGMHAQIPSGDVVISSSTSWAAGNYLSPVIRAFGDPQSIPRMHHFLPSNVYETGSTGIR